MLPADFQLLPMTASDYSDALALWNACEGVRAAETREEFERILNRNAGLSAVVRHGPKLAAAVLCCHDGRRGYLYHLGVAAECRHLGLGRMLVEHCLARLKEQGISRCSIFLIVGNQVGEAFWKRINWRERTDLKVLACDF
jgi:N-acetylglutamate synthase